MHIQSVHGIHLVHFLSDEENSDEDDDDDDEEEESEESAKMEVDIKQKQKKTEETPKTAVRNVQTMVRPSDITRWCDFAQSTSHRIRSHNSQKIA